MRFFVLRTIFNGKRESFINLLQFFFGLHPWREANITGIRLEGHFGFLYFIPKIFVFVACFPYLS